MINATDEQARFFDVCETVLINIESIIVSVSVFVVKRFDHEFFLKRFFSTRYSHELCQYKWKIS